jgi:deazaflavin-dependent oxidoreductase (nitroreductase family)
MTFARFLKSLTRFRRIQPQVGRLHAAVLRRSRGRLRRSRILAGGQPVLALTTTGRRTGRPRSTTVAYLRHGEAYAVGALNLGSDRDPAWCLNLRADPRAQVTVDGERKMVQARRASGEEAELLWRGFIGRLPAIANSRRLAYREVPIMVLEPVAETTTRSPAPSPSATRARA